MLRWNSAIDVDMYGAQMKPARANAGNDTPTGTPRPSGSMATPNATTMPMVVARSGQRRR